jgi:hypothetical protein
MEKGQTRQYWIGWVSGLKRVGSQGHAEHPHARATQDTSNALLAGAMEMKKVGNDLSNTLRGAQWSSPE